MLGQSTGEQAVLDVILRGLLPLAIFIGGFGWIAWRYGRLYCGWLCPHFSVVELINGLMRRASARPNVWEKTSLPKTRADGSRLPLNKRYWWLVAIAVVGFAFLWAFISLTYLLPPAEMYYNLLHASFTRNQSIFLVAATTVLTLEFLLARHLFCRFGCAVGVFQSLVWMANRRGMVVGFDRQRASACSSCDTHCEHVCPMRLKPRSTKRHMFTCTECGQCIAACEQVQAQQHPGQTSILQWLDGACALDVSARDFGQRPPLPQNCYRR
jgi:polyferredoxin